MASRDADSAESASPTRMDAAVTGDFSATSDSAERGPQAAPDQSSTVSATSLVAGREQLGRFRLLERLGGGGMGEVFRAQDTTDGSIVAIKVLAAEFARQSEALRRFHKEARLLAEVHSPYIANLIEVNEDEGIHFLAMEFVAGTSLAAFIRERRQLDEPLALSLMCDVARGLAVAHERGIVHRDIKPENVLLQEAEGGGQRAESQKASGPSPSALRLPRPSALRSPPSARNSPTLDSPGTSSNPNRSTSRGLARSWARRSTCRRSNAAVTARWTRGRMCMLAGRRCFACWPAGRRSWPTIRSR